MTACARAVGEWLDTGPVRALAFTEQQEAILLASGPRIFVSAAAGSGKTAVLVEKYVCTVLETGVLPEELPTVTFTRKAAAELTSRIRQRLRAEGRPDLAWGLDEAPIGTIHGLCARLLRTHATACGLDPAFAVLDEETSRILLDRASEKAWARVLCLGSDAEREALARHGRSVLRAVVSAYKSLRQVGIDNPRLRFAAPPDVDAVREQTLHVVSLCLEEGRRYDDGKVRVAGNVRALEACLDWLPVATPVWGDVLRVRTFLPHKGCGKAWPAFEPADCALTAFRDALGAEYLRPLGAAADELIVETGRVYAEGKRELGGLDFQDLELEAARLLAMQSDAGVAAGVAALNSVGRPRMLMIDEFQDTNALQSRILELLGAECVVTVGDLYQSIYAFRGADCRVFEERRKQVSKESATGDGCGAVYHSLDQNFRSRSELISFINCVCGSEAFFGADFPRLACGETVSGGGPKDGGEAAAVTLAVCPRTKDSDDGVSGDAYVAAMLIDDLVSGEGYTPGQVALLLRKLSDVEQYEAALKTAGLPCYVVQGRGYYERQELTDLSALLRLLLNPHDDRSLVTVARSPLVGVSDDALYLLRRAAGKQASLWAGITRALAGGDLPHSDRLLLTRFCDAFNGLRGRVGVPGISALIGEALSAFDYDLTLLAAPDGRRRLANVRKLMRLADEFENLSGPDLKGFLHYLNLRGENGAREGSANVLAEGEDVVRIMTIHQAKGLEFPVVVLAGLGRGGGGDKGPILVSKDGRPVLTLSTKWRDGFRPLSLGDVEAVRRRMREDDEEEEKRILYVGMTRAEKRLVLVGDVGRHGPDSHLRRLLTALGLNLAGSVEEGGDRGRPFAHLDLEVRRFSGDPPPAGEETVVAQAGGGAAAGPPPAMPAAAHACGSAQPSVVSFSLLHEAEHCPQAYYMGHVLGLRDLGRGAAKADLEAPWLSEDLHREDGHRVEGRVLGTIVHRALEMLDLTAPPEQAALERVVVAAAAEAGRSAADGICARANELVRGFWRSPLSSLPSLARAEKECGFQFLLNSILVRGVFDVLLRGDDEWRIIDYKSNRVSSQEVATVAAGYELQMELYALGGLLAGAPAVRVDLLFLAQPDCALARTYGVADVSVLRTRVETAVGRLKGAMTEKHEDGCGSCDYRSVCEQMSRGAGI